MITKEQFIEFLNLLKNNTHPGYLDWIQIKDQENYFMLDTIDCQYIYNILVYEDELALFINFGSPHIKEIIISSLDYNDKQINNLVNNLYSYLKQCNLGNSLYDLIIDNIS